MKSIWKFPLSKVLLLALAAMGTAAIPAHAQTAAGTFSLAHKVLWAGAVLPAGDYAFSVNTEALPPRVTVRQVGGRIVAMLLSQSISEDSFVDSSSLVLHHEGGESVVSTLRLKNIGMALEFATPKLATPVAETAGLGPIAESQPAK
ncbi:MAG TPA: hypothetical protein VE263_08845 [Candidatus Angelobacter sp.]|jgi:hypothetical protein|nr:hypothetical protein [Candidatus Angelobacter sp.]